MRNATIFDLTSELPPGMLASKKSIAMSIPIGLLFAMLHERTKNSNAN